MNLESPLKDHYKKFLVLLQWNMSAILAKTNFMKVNSESLDEDHGFTKILQQKIHDRSLNSFLIEKNQKDISLKNNQFID